LVGLPQVAQRLRVEGVKWQPEEEKCSSCGYDWTVSLDVARLLVEGSPDRFTRLLNDTDGAASEAPGRWSAAGYLWHVVDVIRFGTERLWTLAMDAASGVPGWDQDALADIRHYENLSTAVGLRALRVAVRDWVQAAAEAPETGQVEHPVFGTLTTADSIRRNAHEVQHHELDVRRALAAE
jgi:hypothetical protein